MKPFSIAVVVSALVSTAALVALVAADRELGAPIPYAVSCVVAMLNITAGLVIGLPRRVDLVQAVAPRPVPAPIRVARATEVVLPAGSPIDEAVVWFETVVPTANEAAA